MSWENENLDENREGTKKKPSIWKEFKTANPTTAKALKVGVISTGVTVGAGIVFATGGAAAGAAAAGWIVINAAVPTTTLATLGTAGIVGAGVGGTIGAIGGIIKGIDAGEKEAERIDKKIKLQKQEKEKQENEEKQNSTNEDMQVIASAPNETEMLATELNFEEIQRIEENRKNEAINKSIVNKPNVLKM